MLNCAIFCGPGTADIATAAFRHYHAANLATKFILVTPHRYAVEAEILCRQHGAELLCDEEVVGFDQVCGWLEQRTTSIERAGRSRGWYLQQYLKFAVAWQASERLFIHDGDTIFSAPLLARLAESPLLLTTREDPSNYNNACAALGLPLSDRSFVANGGLFDGMVLRQWGANPADWFCHTMDSIIFASPGGADFSEYQIMGNLIAGRWPQHHMRFFRRFDLLVPAGATLPSENTIATALRRFDAIAFERGHRASKVKQLLGRVAYLSGRTW